jgi:toxin ParE1/3/4
VKPVRLRPRAEQDLIAAADFYRQQGGAVLAQRVFEAALVSFEAIQRMPGIGSRRIGELCEVPGLRSWGVNGFPMQWFYFEADDHLDVVRLLGDRQDIATILRSG